MILWFLISAVMVALAPLFPKPEPAPPLRATALPEPYCSMRELSLTERDRRFAADFPGDVRRLSDGKVEYILRRVDAATRKLHPAEHCFRGAGYRIEPERMERNHSCFAAVKGERLKVCQQIFNAAGEHWSDVSSWYWHALLAQSQGPWWAVTEIRRE